MQRSASQALKWWTSGKDESRVHVFYRLNKARHAQAREARRNAAMESALAEYAMGMEPRASGTSQQALNHLGAGVMALEEFWNEVNRTELEGQMVTLEPHLLRTMRNTVLAIQLDGTVDAVDLSATNNFKFPLGYLRHHRWPTRHGRSPEIPIPQRNLHEARDGIHR